MEAKAIARHVRVTPRKMRLIAQQVNRNSVSDALTKLHFINKSAAPHMLKVVKSAVANATKNFGVDADNLRIKDIIVDQGPTLKYAKRFIARAMGRASKINKRSCHITVTVTDTKK
jgi:large subunit ribosomal protein L22